MGSLRLGSLALVLLLRHACPDRHSANSTNPSSDGPMDSIRNSVQSGLPEEIDSIEDLKANLSQSPLSLSGVKLGIDIENHNRRYEPSEFAPEDHWEVEGETGLQFQVLQSESGPEIEHNYYLGGVLVGFVFTSSIFVEQFADEVDALSEQFGDPTEDPPLFVKESEVYKRQTQKERMHMYYWVDEKTRSVLIAGYADGMVALWMLIHPDSYDYVHNLALGSQLLD